MRSERTKILARKYRLSIKGKAAEKRYKQGKAGKEAARRYRLSKKGLEKFLNTPRGRYIIARKNGRRRHNWEINENDYALIIKNNCFYCNGELPKFGIALDRIDSSKHYSKDNVVPCCKICNSVKGNWWTLEETKCAVDAVAKYRLSRGVKNNGVPKFEITN